MCVPLQGIIVRNCVNTVDTIDMESCCRELDFRFFEFFEISARPKKLVDLLTRWLVDFAKLAQLCFLFLPMSQGA